MKKVIITLALIMAIFPLSSVNAKEDKSKICRYIKNKDNFEFSEVEKQNESGELKSGSYFYQGSDKEDKNKWCNVHTPEEDLCIFDKKSRSKYFKKVKKTDVRDELEKGSSFYQGSNNEDKDKWCNHHNNTSNSVPEFGFIQGVIASMGAGVSYLIVKSKMNRS